MLALLSVGMLALLTGTGVSHVAPAFAEKEECEDNDDNNDNNCNETNHKIIQENNCKAVNEFEKIGSMNNPTNNNQFICNNVLTSPANGNDNVFGDSALTPNSP